MHKLYLAKDVRKLDRIVIDEFAVPGYDLMERAGNAAFDVLKRLWPANKKITVICGHGNNAGDGYIVARLAHKAGYQVQVFSLTDVELLRDDAMRAARGAIDAGVALISCASELDTSCFFGSDVLVDGIFGSGLNRPVEGQWYDVIQAINMTERPVLALDVPSGLDADSGAVLGIAVKAAHTVSFIALKQGLYTGQGREYCGRVHLADLAVPVASYQRVPVSAQLINYASLADEVFKSRHACAHKAQHGHVLVVGGDEGMSGALRLAGEAAIRSGAGLVSLATRRHHAALLSVGRPELMSHGVESVADLKHLSVKASIIAIGPGLGLSNWAKRMFAASLECQCPMVVDADALSLLAQEHHHKASWILTPHPGEAARLLGVTSADIEHDRFSAVRAIQKRYGGIVVLKGAGTLICYGSHAVVDVCNDGNPGMAVGGMGDVLTGILASLIAQKLPQEQAVRSGVCLHSAAADCASNQGQRGMLASDLFPYLRRMVNPQQVGMRQWNC